MSQWDVFMVRDFSHQYGLDESAVRAMLKSGALQPTDKIRPTGETSWRRVGDMPQWLAEADTVHADMPADHAGPAMPLAPAERELDSPIGPAVSPPTAAPDYIATAPVVDLERALAEAARSAPTKRSDPPPPPLATPRPPRVKESEVAKSRKPSRGAADEVIEPDAQADEPTLPAIAPRRMADEPLDLTAMVDMTFLLIMFFMLTATYTLQKSMPTPKPDPEQKTAAQALQMLDDLKDEAIIVVIEADNTLTVDDEPVTPDNLLASIRKINHDTARNELIIQVAGEARHETVVMVLDTAQELGLQKIGLAALDEDEP